MKITIYMLVNERSEFYVSGASRRGSRFKWTKSQKRGTIWFNKIGPTLAIRHIKKYSLCEYVRLISREVDLPSLD